MQSRELVLSGAIMGFLGVALGAFGAHALKSTLEALDTLSTWETGVHYLQWQAIALVVGGLVLSHRDAKILLILWMTGLLLFSGSLFGLALGGPRWLGPVTPLGGLCLMGGWAWLGISVVRVSRRAAPTG
jgi:uncharacterized membrane protein YgdD (TMEM256/DUF423 family)